MGGREDARNIHKLKTNLKKFVLKLLKMIIIYDKNGKGTTYNHKDIIRMKRRIEELEKLIAIYARSLG